MGGSIDGLPQTTRPTRRASAPQTPMASLGWVEQPPNRALSGSGRWRRSRAVTRISRDTDAGGKREDVLCVCNDVAGAQGGCRMETP